MTRFNDFRWLAWEETGRAKRRRLAIEADDAHQAALIGLHQADLAAPATMAAWEFERFARFRIRGEIIDEFRRIRHGSRRGDRAGATKPWHANATDVHMAQLEGLLPFVAVELDGEATAVSRCPTPEQAAISAEAERERQRRIAALPKREATMVRMRLAGRKGPEIAKLFGVSEPRISQLLARAVRRIAM